MTDVNYLMVYGAIGIDWVPAHLVSLSLSLTLLHLSVVMIYFRVEF